MAASEAAPCRPAGGPRSPPRRSSSQAAKVPHGCKTPRGPSPRPCPAPATRPCPARPTSANENPSPRSSPNSSPAPRATGPPAEIPRNDGDAATLALLALASSQQTQCSVRPDESSPLMTSVIRHMHLEPVSPDNAMPLFVDQQEGWFSRIYEPGQTRSNVLALARSARLLGIPAALTTALAAGPNGPQLPELTEIFSGQEVIDRTLI